MIDRREQPQCLDLRIVQGLFERVHGRKARVDVGQIVGPRIPRPRREDRGQLRVQALALRPVTCRQRRQFRSTDALEEIQQELRLQRAQRDVAQIGRGVDAVVRQTTRQRRLAR